MAHVHLEKKIPAEFVDAQQWLGAVKRSTFGIEPSHEGDENEGVFTFPFPYEGTVAYRIEGHDCSLDLDWDPEVWSRERQPDLEKAVGQLFMPYFYEEVSGQPGA